MLYRAHWERPSAVVARERNRAKNTLLTKLHTIGRLGDLGTLAKREFRLDIP